MGTINNIPPGIPDPEQTLNHGIIDGHEISNSPEDKLMRWGPTVLTEKEASWKSPFTSGVVVGPGTSNNPTVLA